MTPSFSRPAVSDDNPFIESLFRTLKYRPDHPMRRFADIEEAVASIEAFVRWYNPRAPALEHRLRHAARAPRRRRPTDPRPPARRPRGRTCATSGALDRRHPQLEQLYDRYGSAVDDRIRELFFRVENIGPSLRRPERGW
jgi:hypothetical protein